MSVQSICRKISGMTDRRQGWQPSEEIVERLNRTIIGWANYFSLGQVTPAYSAVRRHSAMRLRRWLCLKHKAKFGKHVRFSDDRLHDHYGLICLTRQTMGLPRVNA